MALVPLLITVVYLVVLMLVGLEGPTGVLEFLGYACALLTEFKCRDCPPRLKLIST